MKQNKKYLWIPSVRKCVVICFTLIFIAGLVAVQGCGREESQRYIIYYMNNNADQLVEKEMDIASDCSKEDIAMQMLTEMSSKQKQDDYNVIKPNNIIIQQIMLDNDTMQVYFSKEYTDMNNAREVLFRSAVVHALTQIEDINYVRFYIDGAEAVYENGTVIGQMSAADFIDDASEEIDSVEWKNIKLYYANKLGDKLIEQNEQIAYSKNVSLERLVMERLIKGPNNKTEYATVPKDLKLLSISTSNGVCYVNLNSVFLTEMVNVSGEVSLYSIVNSLCSLDGVNTVKIMINGDSEKTFRENISLSNEYYYNTEIVN